MPIEKLGTTSVDIDRHTIQIADLEVETFAAGGNGHERSIIHFRAPTALPQPTTGRRAETHATTKSYSIHGPNILSDNIFERITDIQTVIRGHLARIYGITQPFTDSQAK